MYNYICILNPNEATHISHIRGGGGRYIYIFVGGIYIVDPWSIRNENEIKIEYIGLISGEKLHEELLIGNNIIESTYPDILIAREDYVAWPNLEIQISNLKKLIEKRDIYEAINAINEIVLLDKTR